LRFDERPIRDDLLGVYHTPLRAESIAGVGHPALLQGFADPIAPLLHVLLDLLGRHLGVGLVAATVNKEKLGHEHCSFSRVSSRADSASQPASQAVSNELRSRGQENSEW